MKVTAITLCASMMLGFAGQLSGEGPPPSMIEHAKWAREAKELTVRIKRLEEFLKGYIPLEEGVVVVTEHEDGASALAVTGSAWTLARAYVEDGQKDKALRMIGWLQEHDSKSELIP